MHELETFPCFSLSCKVSLFLDFTRLSCRTFYLKFYTKELAVDCKKKSLLKTKPINVFRLSPKLNLHAPRSVTRRQIYVRILFKHLRFLEEYVRLVLHDTVNYCWYTRLLSG